MNMYVSGPFSAGGVSINLSTADKVIDFPNNKFTKWCSIPDSTSHWTAHVASSRYYAYKVTSAADNNSFGYSYIMLGY